MRFKRGDHICSLYSTTAELGLMVGSFLADGLRQGERCWYVASGNENDAVRNAVMKHGIDVASETSRGALRLISDDGAYIVRGAFTPESTIQVFNDAIEQAYTDGYKGFRAAADMSWAMDCEDGPSQLIEYEALLRSLFANCGAIGLCLYDRQRMPLAVLNGALATHPIVGSHGRCRANPFYDATTERLSPANDAEVLAKLAWLGRSPRSRRSGA